MKKTIYNPALVLAIALIYLTIIAPALVSSASTELVVLGLTGMVFVFFYIYKATVFFLKVKTNEND